MSLPVSVGKGIELSDMKAYLEKISTVRDQRALLKRWISLLRRGLLSHRMIAKWEG